MKRKALISIVLILGIVFLAGGGFYLFHTANDGIKLVNGLIPEQEFKEKKHTALDDSAETNEFSLMYDNQDGTKSLYVFSSPVQYQKDGQYKLIDNTLIKSSEGYIFENKENDIHTYYPDMRSQTDFLIEFNDIKLTMQAIHNACEIKKTQQKTIFDVKQEMVEYYKDKNVSISYFTTNLGLKCQIEIQKPTDDLSFDFGLKSDLFVNSQNEQYFQFRDSGNQLAALLYQPVSVDKNGEYQPAGTAELSMGEYSEGNANINLSIKPGLDKSKYPLTVEFSFNMYKGNQVDSAIQSLQPNSNQYLNNYLLASSAQRYGQAESYIRFEDRLLDQYVSENELQAAHYIFYGLSRKKKAGLSLYQCDNHWTSTKITWNTRQSFSTKLNSIVPLGSHTYSADVTDLVRSWPGDPVKKDCGFLIRADEAQFEAFASGDNGYMMPRLEIKLR